MGNFWLFKDLLGKLYRVKGWLYPQPTKGKHLKITNAEVSGALRTPICKRGLLAIYPNAQRWPTCCASQITSNKVDQYNKLHLTVLNSSTHDIFFDLNVYQSLSYPFMGRMTLSYDPKHLVNLQWTCIIFEGVTHGMMLLNQLPILSLAAKCMHFSSLFINRTILSMFCTMSVVL